MPFYDNPLKLEMRRKFNLVDDQIDLEYDIVDDLKPIWVLNKKVPFKSVLKDLKDWQDRYVFRKFYSKWVRGTNFSFMKAIAVTKQYALRYCRGNVVFKGDLVMVLACNKTSTVVVDHYHPQYAEGPFCYSRDRSKTVFIDNTDPITFVRKFGAEFQFFFVYL
mgnify:CR=1 FL=1